VTATIAGAGLRAVYGQARETVPAGELQNPYHLGGRMMQDHGPGPICDTQLYMARGGRHDLGVHVDHQLQMAEPPSSTWRPGPEVSDPTCMFRRNRHLSLGAAIYSWWSHHFGPPLRQATGVLWKKRSRLRSLRAETEPPRSARKPLI
jgi:hypothetical protein